MMNQESRWALTATMAALSCVPNLSAQSFSSSPVSILSTGSGNIGGGTSVGGADFVEAWVDADFGGLSPMVGDPTRPYGDIQSAINAVRNVLDLNSGGPTEGLVHINPAIYEVGSTIVLAPDVHLQGKDAGACIIRPSAAMGNYAVFLPEGDTCGVTSDLRVLMAVPSLQAEGAQDDVVELVEGLQFQGGDVQLYMEKEHDGAITIANCIFDMLPERIDDEYGDPSTAPLFGILMVETWDLAIGGYHDFDASILNNTFIQGHRTDFGEATVVGHPDGAAIVSVNNPVCDPSSPGDPDPTLRQVIDLNVQNNLIRSFDGHLRTSMLGVSGEDARVAIGSRLGGTNAFVRGTAGSTGLTGRFHSQVKSVAPLPKVSLRSIDPGFVGEMGQDVLPHFGNLFDPAMRDWRLVPGSPLEDRGSAPNAEGVLMSESGVAYVHGANAPMPRSAFDWDCEHYGNRRIEGGGIDIGADEVGDFILITRINDTLTPINGATQPDQVGLFRSPSRIRLRQQILVPYLPQLTAWSSPPGSRVPPKTVILPGGVVATNWLLSPLYDGETATTTTWSWTNPADGSLWDVHLAAVYAPANPGSLTTYSQAVIEPLGQAKFWSNTQYSE